MQSIAGIEKYLNQRADEEETKAERCIANDLNAAYHYHKGKSEAFRIAAIRLNKFLFDNGVRAA